LRDGSVGRRALATHDGSGARLSLRRHPPERRGFGRSAATPGAARLNAADSVARPRHQAPPARSPGLFGPPKRAHPYPGL